MAHNVKALLSVLEFEKQKIENMIRRLLELLKLKQPHQPILQQCSVSGSCYDAHEQLLIEKVIEMVKTKP